MIALKHVLVATDFSPPSDVALAYGRALAERFGATLHLLHVDDNQFLQARVSDPGSVSRAHQRWLEERLTPSDRSRLNARASIEVNSSAAAAIVSYAQRSSIDLIIVGTHGRSGLSHVLVGSVAERVVRTAPCPVLTVRHPEHEFVVPDDSERRDDHDAA